MARTRRLDDLRTDAYKRSDNEGATDRHPAADVTRYLNQGGAALWDLLIEARGREFCRKATPQTITTTASTTSYTLSSDFYQLISVRLTGDSGGALMPFTALEEPELRSTYAQGEYPMFYELRRDAIAILPAHSAGLSIVVEYVPAWTDLVSDSDTANGVNGWEDYMVDWAAKQMALKDEEFTLAGILDASMNAMRERIMKLAPKRDAFRAKRVRDVRGPMAFRRGWRW